MKHFKKIMALAIAMAMMLSMMSISSFAEEVTKGSITVNSPIMGAQYSAYKIFDLSMDDNADPSAFSYTIDKDSPFFKAVQSYATEKKTIVLTATQSDPDTYNVTVAEGKSLDAQDFGKYLRDRLAADYEGEDKIINPTAISPTYEKDKTEVTPAKADAITFENLDFGYYLITNNYDDPEARTTVKLEIGTEGQDGYQKWEFTSKSTEDEIKTGAKEYALAKYPDLAAAETYVSNNAASFEKKWADMTDAEKNKVLKDLQDTTEANAVDQIKQTIAAAASDDNAQETTERFVFVDSTTPNAVINEKNEVHKWDVPVNPDGHSELPDLPDHDEPKGGKNIVVGESGGKTVYGDTSEAAIGDDIHYQLSINAVNFERKDGVVKQIKEYVIADYQNKNMEFVKDKKLTVTIVKKDKDGNITETLVDALDYTSWVEKGYFFTNTDKTDLDGGDVFNGTGGIVIPWIEEITAEEAKTRPNVTTTTFDKVDAEGNPVYQKADANTPENVARDNEGYLLDENGKKIPEVETHYFASLYPNDVTILVDYYMTLTDTATIDGDGNVNTSQYGVDYLEPTDKEYKPATNDTPPDKPKEPTEKKEKDTATVYTYAFAIKKVDDAGNTLAGAKFKLRGVEAVEKTKGWYKVSAYDHKSTDFGTELETDDNGILVVEGLPQKWAIEVQETEAPAGFNKLTETKLIEPVKTGSEMTTTSKVTYTDEDGNTTESTTTTTEYKNKAGEIVAKVVKVGNTIKYYGAGGTTETDEATFNSLVTQYATVDKAEVTKPANIAELEIVNQKGTELPSTGGIGTTIFYVIGAILVIGAGVIMVTRRRMDA